MRAMVLSTPRRPLEPREMPMPDGDLVVRVECCAVCRTDLHVLDGELPQPKLPLIPGHQIVGVTGAGVRVGIPWLGWTCGTCVYCTSGRENLCDRARFTGYTLDGGYAEYAAADRRFVFPIPESYSSEEAAPLLCAGLIGFRAYRMACDVGPRPSALGPRDGGGTPRAEGRGPSAEVRRLGFYGFGSAAQILAQIARADGREVFAFTRRGDADAQNFARDMGAVWAGDAGAAQPLDAAIVFAPAGELVVTALRNVVKGGSVIAAGIHMSDIPAFPYELLWGERVIRSVANLTREDGETFIRRIANLRIETKRTLYPLENANEALDDLRSGRLTGTAVLKVIS